MTNKLTELGFKQKDDIHYYIVINPYQYGKQFPNVNFRIDATLHDKKVTLKLIGNFPENVMEYTDIEMKRLKIKLKPVYKVDADYLNFTEKSTDWQDKHSKEYYLLRIHNREKAPPEDLFDQPFEHGKIKNDNIKVNHDKLNLTKNLRDYQKKATEFALKHKHSIIELPTGRGKTLVGISIVKHLTDKQPKKILVLVPTLVLMQQWVEDGFKESSVKASTVFGGKKQWSQFTVSTYQSASKHIESLPQFDIIVFDEIHHLFAPKYVDILRILMENGHGDKLHMVGLTATVRTVGNEAYIQNKYFPDRFTMKFSDFQQGSGKIPIEIKRYGVLLKGDTREEYNATARTIAIANSKFGSIVEWVKYVNSEDPKTAALARGAIKAYNKQKVLLSEIPDKIGRIKDIISKTPGQFIVFTDTIEAMHKISSLLRRSGIKNEIINSEVPLYIRGKIIQDLKAGKLRVLVGGNAITEGLDLPDIDNAIIASLLVKTPRSYVQRLGRVMRPTPGKHVKIFILYAKGTIEQTNMKIIYDELGEDYNDDI
jgi:superfamily II DNA or RNA helicase